MNGGDLNAKIKDYPYMTSLRFETQEETFCSGILIDSQFILTAGHCIKTEPDAIIAHLGTGFGTGLDGEQIKVIERYQHPMYNETSYMYDVGLLKLEKPSIQKMATMGALDRFDNLVGTNAVVLGWGLTEDGSRNLKFRKTHATLISNAECNEQFSISITEGMICARNKDSKDSCNRDIGGPLITTDGILIGFASLRGKCGADAGIYTRLTIVMDFISDVLGGGTGRNFTDGTASMTQQTSLTTPGFADTPTVASLVATTSTGPTAVSLTTKDVNTESTYGLSTKSTPNSVSTRSFMTGSGGFPTASLRLSATESDLLATLSSMTDAFASAMSTTMGALTSTAGPWSPTTLSASDHAVLRRLEKVDEKEIEEELKVTDEAQKIIEKVELEAENEIEDGLDSDNDDEVAEGLAMQVAALKEGKEIEKVAEEVEKEEEKLYDEEVKEMEEDVENDDDEDQDDDDDDDDDADDDDYSKEDDGDNDDDNDDDDDEVDEASKKTDEGDIDEEVDSSAKTPKNVSIEDKSESGEDEEATPPPATSKKSSQKVKGKDAEQIEKAEAKEEDEEDEEDNNDE
ncbi:unnamed protein product [Peronospora belbahrii]|nr:unnamed protein product [Peronospora belbahrii]